MTRTASTKPSTKPAKSTDKAKPAADKAPEASATPATSEAPAPAADAPAPAQASDTPAAPAATDGDAPAPAPAMPKGGLQPFRARNLGRLDTMIDAGTKLGTDLAKAVAAGDDWTKPHAPTPGANPEPSISDLLSSLAAGCKALQDFLNRAPEDYTPQRRTIAASFADGDSIRVAADRCGPNTKLGMVGITADMIGKIQSSALAHKGGEGYLCVFHNPQGVLVAQQFIGGAGLIKVTASDAKPAAPAAQ